VALDGNRVFPGNSRNLLLQFVEKGVCGFFFFLNLIDGFRIVRQFAANRRFRCLLLLTIPHLFLSKAFMSILQQTETAEAEFGCSGLLYIALAPSQQHSMTEAPSSQPT